MKSILAPHTNIKDDNEVTGTFIAGNKHGMDVMPHNLYAEIMLGNVDSQVIVNKFGANSAIGTSWTPLCSSGVYKTPTALTSLELVSSSANDSFAAGSGARTVKVIGLSTNWLEVEETIQTNGLSAVALANQHYRIYRMSVETSGTYGSQVAPSHNSTITLREAGAGATWATIETIASFGLGQSQIGVYSLAAGKTAFLLGYHLDLEANKAVDAVLYVRENADTIAAPFSAMKVKAVKQSLLGNHEARETAPITQVTGPADIGFMAKVASGTAQVDVEFQLLVIPTPS